MRDFVKQELIFMTLAGSRLYGTSTPESDVDKRGVCVPPQNVELGFARGFKQQEYEGEDTVVYSLRRFMELASGSNPNVIELLFVPSDCIETTHPTWEKLRARRKEFLSAKCYKTFTGYATGQLKRMKGVEGLTTKKDSKPAMHTIRLLRMCEEILTTGEPRVRRPDAAQLLEIRNGEWTYSKVRQEAGRIHDRLTAIYDQKSYTIPEAPPILDLSDFAVELYQYHWSLS